MRYRSAKKEEQYRDRRVVVEQLLRQRTQCEACAVFAGKDGKRVYRASPPTDIHEIVRRSQGGSILDEGNLLAICRTCHGRINAGPAEAQQTGLQLPSWATPEMRTEAALIRAKWAKGEPCQPSWI